jgi:hypothetical protein
LDLTPFRGQALRKAFAKIKNKENMKKQKKHEKHGVRLDLFPRSSPGIRAAVLEMTAMGFRRQVDARGRTMATN